MTQIVQQDLTTLGYDTGQVDGQASTKTIIAVSRFQSEHDLEVTGEIMPRGEKYRLFIAVPFWQESISVLV